MRANQRRFPKEENCLFLFYLSREPMLVVIAVRLLSIIFPKNDLTAVNSNCNIYTSSQEEHSPAFVYKNCNATRKPLNDIPNRKGTTYTRMSCFFFASYTAINFARLLLLHAKIIFIISSCYYMKKNTLLLNHYII